MPAFAPGMWRKNKEQGDKFPVQHDPLNFVWIINGNPITVEKPGDGMPGNFVEGVNTAVHLLKKGVPVVRFLGSESSIDAILERMNGTDSA